MVSFGADYRLRQDDIPKLQILLTDGHFPALIDGHLINNGDVISMGRSEFTMMAAKAQPVGV